jgi:hypothetical protein
VGAGLVGLELISETGCSCVHLFCVFSQLISSESKVASLDLGDFLGFVAGGFSQRIWELT